MRLTRLALILVLYWVCGYLHAQEADHSSHCPAVHLIGTYHESFPGSHSDKQSTLLQIYDHNLEEAFSQWTDLIRQMEEYANKRGFRLAGLKLWLNVQWDEQGRISHIAYFPRPNSRNISQDEITAFLRSFIYTKVQGLATGGSYNHYGSVSFPYLPRRVGTHSDKVPIGG